MGKQPEIKTHLRRLRLMSKLSKNFVAAKAKISPHTLMHLEQRAHSASQWSRKKLAKFYGLPENMLFDDEGYPLEV